MSTRFLVRFFKNQTLWPFAVYCLVVGVICMIYFAVIVRCVGSPHVVWARDASPAGGLRS